MERVQLNEQDSNASRLNEEPWSSCLWDLNADERTAIWRRAHTLGDAEEKLNVARRIWRRSAIAIGILLVVLVPLIILHLVGVRYISRGCEDTYLEITGFTTASTNSTSSSCADIIIYRTVTFHSVTFGACEVSYPNNTLRRVNDPVNELHIGDQLLVQACYDPDEPSCSRQLLDPTGKSENNSTHGWTWFLVAIELMWILWSFFFLTQTISCCLSYRLAKRIRAILSRPGYLRGFVNETLELSVSAVQQQLREDSNNEEQEEEQPQPQEPSLVLSLRALDEEEVVAEPSRN